MRFGDLLAATALAAGVTVSGPTPAVAQSPAAPESPTRAPAAAPPAPAPAPDPDPAELARIKRLLATPSPVLDAAVNAPPPTFRVSVSERIDIWRYWGDPDAVAGYVRPSGGPWHHEFQNMVTPDEYKGYGAIFSNGEKAQLAASSLAFAGAMQLVGAGIKQIKGAIEQHKRNRAKAEVQRELAAFCAANPGACPEATPTPP